MNFVGNCRFTGSFYFLLKVVEYCLLIVGCVCYNIDRNTVLRHSFVEIAETNTIVPEARLQVAAGMGAVVFFIL